MKKNNSPWKWILAGAAGYWAWRTVQEQGQSGRFLAADSPRGTAVITGASSGIGEAFARQLAQMGYDLVLVARGQEKLAQIAAELQTKHGILAEVVAADLSKAEGVERVEEAIGKLDDLVLLINNAGFGTMGPLLEKGLFRQLDMIHVHVNASMRLTRAALTRMVDKGYGGVINVSSIVAFFHGAGSANYCATKAYLNTFSQAVQAEVRENGLFVQALCPGYTYTNFHDTGEYDAFSRNEVPGWLWMSAAEVADISLNALGNGRVVLVPGAVNQAIVQFARTGIDLAILRRLAKRLKGK